MNLNDLASYVAKQETGKTEVSIGQIKEIIKIVSIAMYKNPALIAKLIANGEKNYFKGIKG
jgi:hypothetical protein